MVTTNNPNKLSFDPSIIETVEAVYLRQTIQDQIHAGLVGVMQGTLDKEQCDQLKELMQKYNVTVR